MNPLKDPIITSLCDTDKYKISMLMFFMEQTPKAVGRYKFNCRTKGVDLTLIIPALRAQVEMLGDLAFTDTEIQYLAREPHLSRSFLGSLRDFRLDPRDVHIGIKDGQLSIEVGGKETPLTKASPWEIYLLALVNELYFRQLAPQPDWNLARERLMNQLQPLIDRKTDSAALDGYSLSEFGTRRRFSKEWQSEVVATLKAVIPDQFFGTSNYHFAREYGLTAVGTMAHEYLQAWQAFVHPLDAQKRALDGWAEEFRGSLGYALTDVIGMEAFCKDIDGMRARQFDGFRQDSGDPVWWGEMLINRLQELGVDPTTKYALWSDSLNVEKSLAIFDHFRGRIRTAFAIGTQFTNDVGFKPINIVMKLVECNGRPVAKLSDSPGKTMCEDASYVRWLAASYGREKEFAV